VVESLKTEEALVLIMETVSKLLFLGFDMEMGCEMEDMPDIDAGPDLKLPEAECGRLSGNMAFTKVARSAGLITK
jgi:hypothetical protein